MGWLKYWMMRFDWWFRDWIWDHPAQYILFLLVCTTINLANIIITLTQK